MKKILLLSLFSSISLLSFSQYREVKLPNKPTVGKDVDYSTKDSGFWCATDFEAGSSIMVNSHNMQYLNLAFTGGYRFNEYLRLGLGMGVRYYVNNAAVRDTDNKFGIPLYVNARGNFISAYNRDGVPFWSLNVGGITNEGFFASPTLGYSFGGLRNNLQVGLSYTFTTFQNYRKSNVAYSYFALKVGYEF
jgi:hypothetical protein